MPQGNEYTTKFKVDITDLKAGLQDANQQIKLANAEFNAASAGMDDWGSSADGISAKLKQLSEILEAQKTKLNVYVEEQRRMDEAAAENGRRADELREKLSLLASQGVSKTSEEYQKYQKELTEVEKEQTANEKASDNLKVTILNQQAAVNKTEKDIRQYSTALDEVEKESKEADQAAGDIKKSLDEVGDSAEKSIGGFTAMKGALANLIADGIRTAISAMKDFVKESIEVGAAFGASMSQVAAISGATGEDFDALREKALEMGAKTKFSASEAADAMNYMAMAGWKTEDMLGGIEGIMNLAAASGENLATTSDIVTDALTAFGMTADDAGHFADILAAASSNANTNVSMMGETFKYVAPVAGAMGISAEDTAEAIGLLANAGIKGSQAGTTLRSILTRLSTDTGASATSLGALGTLTEELGVQFYNTDGSVRELNDILAEARIAWANLTEEEAANYGKTIAGTNALSGWMALMNAAPEDIDKLSSAIEHCSDEVDGYTGAAEKMAAVMQDNLSGDLKILESQLEGIQISIYDKFEPALRKGVEILSELLKVIDFVIDHSSEFTAGLTAMAVAIAAYVAYTTAIKVMKDGWMSLEVAQKAVTVAQTLMNAAMTANPIGLVVAAVAGLVAGLVVAYNKVEWFRDGVNAAWSTIKNGVSTALGWVTNFFTETLPSSITSCVDFIKELPDKALSIGNDIVHGLWNGITGAANWLKDKIKGFASGIVDGIKDALNINSPSKVMADEVGRWIPAGVAEGITKNTKSAVNATRDMAKKLLPETKILRANLAPAAAGIRGEIGSGSSTINNFYQYNTSPKALSRLDIYRHSKNLLSQKGA